MTKQITRIVVCGVLAAFFVMSIGSAAFAVADLNDWIGDNNKPPDPEAEHNNYGLITQTSAGGTFQARRTRATAAEPLNNAFFSDPTLVGSSIGLPQAFGFDENISISGTLTFGNPNNLDPNILFGFYEDEPGTSQGKSRLGIAFADSSTDFFRAQTLAANGLKPGVPAASVVRNMNTSGVNDNAGSPLAAGTYPFTFTYTAATHNVSATVGPVSNSNNLSPTAFVNTDVFDRFGFLQMSDQIAPKDFTEFTLSVSNITYSGNTAVGGGGDYNGNNIVDAADYVMWRTNPNTFFGDPGGYTKWRANFGNPPGSGSGFGGGIVPEPSSFALALFFLGFAGSRRVWVRHRGGSHPS